MEREKWGRLTERIEPFSRLAGVGSVQAVIELKHQLLMRLPHPEVTAGPQEHRAAIAHPPAVCFGCLLP